MGRQEAYKYFNKQKQHTGGLLYIGQELRISSYYHTELTAIIVITALGKQLK